MVLTVYFALSLVTGLSCHHRSQETCKQLASRELDASVGASGPHDFAVRARLRWDLDGWRVLTVAAMRTRCRRRVVGAKAVAHGQSRPATLIAPDAVASIAARPAVRDDRDPPLVSGQGVLSVRQIRISVKWNIFATAP